MIYLFIGALLAVAAQSLATNCTDNIECMNDNPYFPICDYWGECVACENNTHCKDNNLYGDDTVCKLDYTTWEYGCEIATTDSPGGCSYNSDCAYPTPVCYSGWYCVECTNNTHCDPGYECDWFSNQCQPNVTVSTTEGPTTTETPCVNNSDCYYSWEPFCAYGKCSECMETEHCTNNTFWYGEGYICEAYECVMGPCTSNDACKYSWAPVCDTDTGDCVGCTETSDCVGLYGDGWTCSGWGSYKSCTNETSPYCDVGDDGDIYCQTEYGEDYTCQDYTDYGYCSNFTYPASPYCKYGDDEYCIEEFGDDYSCQYNPVWNYSMCSDEISIFCTVGSDDCDGYDGYGPWNYECQEISATVNLTENVTAVVSLPLCIPADQCTLDGDDCLLGSTCVEIDADGYYSFNACQLNFEDDCTKDGDCETGLKCFVPESVCYLPCDSYDDCDVDGWYCQNPADDIWACLPKGIDGNFTLLTTTSTTTETPIISTTEDDGPTDGDKSGASQLVIFGGMVVMIKYVLFM